MHIIRYKRWLAQQMDDPDLNAELRAIDGDTEAIRERFAIDLSFGTAGMRGVIGAGTNRMNIYTVRRATQGLANYLKNSSGGEKALSVAVGYDSRIKSDIFAREAARVLAANEITALLYPQLEPVPCLSFAVRKLCASAGIMITASHNPAKYNGYKVYGPDGCQMTTAAAGAVLGEVEKLDIFDDIRITGYGNAVSRGLVLPILEDTLEDYYKNVRLMSVRPGILAACGLKVVYSPLNGAGNLPVRRILSDCGLTDVTVVPAQEMPDGNFTTCPYPNPESREALALGLSLARESGADLMLATDPDADRLGIAVRSAAGDYRLMSGNEIGVLLLSYICQGLAERGALPQNPVLIKSIVSTPMANAVAAKYGVMCTDVLTGFKYIGEEIKRLEEQNQAERFVFGFEESYGYLAGTYVRDKDAVVASMLICEAAAYHKSRGLSLCEVMDGLYAEYGYYLNMLDSFEFAGLSGMEKMDEIMAQLRKTPPASIGGLGVVSAADYAAQASFAADGCKTALNLPPADVLAYTLDGGCLVTVRPSGTEPKVKVYYAVRAKNQSDAEALYSTLSAAMRPTFA